MYKEFLSSLMEYEIFLKESIAVSDTTNKYNSNVLEYVLQEERKEASLLIHKLIVKIINVHNVNELVNRKCDFITSNR